MTKFTHFSPRHAASTEQKNHKCPKIICHLLFGNLFLKLSNPIAKHQNRILEHIKASYFTLLCARSLLSVNNIRISFMFKARNFFWKNYFKATLFIPKRKAPFCFKFQSKPICKHYFANVSTKKDYSLGTKRGCATFFIHSYANFGLLHKRLFWTVVPNVW